MSFQDDLNNDTAGRTWYNPSGKLMGIGRCLMGPLRDIPNPNYPRATTYGRPTQQAIDAAYLNGEREDMDIVNGLYKYDEQSAVWKCTLGRFCGRFPQANGPFEFDQMSCQSHNLPM